MGSRDDPLIVDEGTATVVVAEVQGHLPGLRVSFTLVATHNPVIRRGCRCGVKVKQNAAYNNYNSFSTQNLCTYCRCALPAAPRSVSTIRPIILWLLTTRLDVNDMSLTAFIPQLLYAPPCTLLLPPHLHTSTQFFLPNPISVPLLLSQFPALKNNLILCAASIPSVNE